MHVKFIARGTGSAGAAVDYLLGERDAAGQPRTGVEVLRGDPDQVAAVADSLAFEHKYRSAVIAWSPEDRPTAAQIEAVLDAFEKTAWAGLDADRYSWTAVLHREQGGGVHVHVLTARCDLETGRSLNIAPPGWQKTFDPLRDAFNHEHGWNRPDDPARARAQQPGHRAYIEAANLRTGLEHGADARELIRDYLTQRVEHGEGGQSGPPAALQPTVVIGYAALRQLSKVLGERRIGRVELSSSEVDASPLSDSSFPFLFAAILFLLDGGLIEAERSGIEGLRHTLRPAGGTMAQPGDLRVPDQLEVQQSRVLKMACHRLRILAQPRLRHMDPVAAAPSEDD